MTIFRTTVTGARGPAGHDVMITGALPIGDTTRTVTYFIIDAANKTIVGTVALPDAVNRKTSVSLAVKVPDANAPYEIGTFDEDGFHASSFLSVRNPTTDQPPSAAIGRTG